MRSPLELRRRRFDLPARQSLVPSLVPREDLPNAISLNTIMQQTSQVLGPALGGIVIASSSVGWAYVFNAVSLPRSSSRCC
jgi:MFS family permease